jgi:hypothetical protein
MEKLFDPRQYLGVADRLITRAMEAHRTAASKTRNESE